MSTCPLCCSRRRRLLLAGNTGVIAGLTGWGGYNISGGTSLDYNLYDFKAAQMHRCVLRVDLQL